MRRCVARRVEEATKNTPQRKHKAYSGARGSIPFPAGLLDDLGVAAIKGWLSAEGNFWALTNSLVR